MSIATNFVTNASVWEVRSLRVAREGKERRRKLAQRNAPNKSGESDSKRKKSSKVKQFASQDNKGTEESEDAPVIPGMLPSNIVELLAAREKKTFESDSEEERAIQKPNKRRKKQKLNGILLLASPSKSECQNRMANDDFDSDSDAPEELTNEEGLKQDEEIIKIQRENTIRVAREGKERRRKLAQRNAPNKSGESDSKRKKSSKVKQFASQDNKGTEESEDAPVIPGMLPSNIVELLAAREKKTFESDSEEERATQKSNKRRKKQKLNGPETVLLNEIPAPECLQKSLEFLKRRKMQVPRSNMVLKNSKQALRLLSKT